MVRPSPFGRRLAFLAMLTALVIANIPPLCTFAALPMTGDGSLYYATQGSNTSPNKTYTSFTNTWSSETSMGTETSPVHFIRSASSPVRNEKLTMITNTAGTYEMYRWNGSVWSLEWTDTGGGAAASTYTPRFDFAYDNLGNAFVVYSNNADDTNQMGTRRWNVSTSTWGAKVNYTAAALKAPLAPRYIRVENRPGTDEFVFAWADSAQNLSGNYYDFSANSFSGEPSASLQDNLPVLTGAGSEIRTRVFDMAFETNSGELLICYGDWGGTALECNTRAAGTSGAWGARITYASTTITADEMDMAADPDPASNKIALYTYSVTAADGEALIWSGTAWGNRTAFDATMDTLEAGTANGAVEWVRSGTTSAAIITYDDLNAAGIDWLTFNASTSVWTVQTDSTTAFSTAAVNDLWHEMKRNPNNAAQLALVMVDGNADLSVKRLTFNGTTFTWASMDNGAASHNATMHTSGGWAATYVWANYLMPAVLAIDIVDASGNAVASPAVAMGALAASTACATATGTLGASAQRIRVSNGTTNAAWSLSVAATGGTSAKWTATTETYDYNDNTSAGCSDGADTDSDPGRLTLNPAAGTISPAGTCANTGVSTPASAFFSDPGVNSVTLLTGSASASIGCYWDLTGVALSQTIPKYQFPGTYSLPLTLTITAN